MLSEPERHSLSLIFERVTPDRMPGVVEELYCCFVLQHTDSKSQEIATILEKTVKKLKQIADGLV